MMMLSIHHCPRSPSSSIVFASNKKKNSSGFGFSKPRSKSKSKLEAIPKQQKHLHYNIFDDNNICAKTTLELIISNNNVVLFGFKNCPKTIQARVVLYERYIEFMDVQLDDEIEHLIIIEELSNITGISTLPHIFFHGEFLDITSLPYM